MQEAFDLSQGMFAGRPAPVIAPSLKPQGFGTWALVTPFGVHALTDHEREAIQAALKRLEETKNAGPQLPKKMADKLL